MYPPVATSTMAIELMVAEKVTKTALETEAVPAPDPRSKVVVSPICWAALEPQHRTRWFEKTAHVWIGPEAMVMAGKVSEKRIKDKVFTVPPEPTLELLFVPNKPYSPIPQQIIPPLVKRAHVNCAPVVTCTTEFPSLVTDVANMMGVRLVMSAASVPRLTPAETVAPSCPALFRPQHMSAPDWKSAQVWSDAATWTMVSKAYPSWKLMNDASVISSDPSPKLRASPRPSWPYWLFCSNHQVFG